MYRKELYVGSAEQGGLRKAIIRPYTQDDFPQLIGIQQECFPPPFPSELWWNEEQLINHVTLFSEGALCVEIEGRLAGSMTGLLINYSYGDPDHSWEEATDSGYIRNHNPDGNTLYVVDISVRPSMRKLGLGKLLMQSFYELVIYRGLDRLLGGGRMPGYHLVASQMSAEQYLEEVTAGMRNDPVISFLLRCGRTPIKAAPQYLEDEESNNYAALMEWRNPFRQGRTDYTTKGE
jgi:ribosomal protein S18 acetylase RimI-like enzyme